jgi:hypothetical protein
MKYEATHYVIFSILLLLPLCWVSLFSSALCSQMGSLNCILCHGNSLYTSHKSVFDTYILNADAPFKFHPLGGFISGNDAFKLFKRAEGGIQEKKQL